MQRVARGMLGRVRQPRLRQARRRQGFELLESRLAMAAQPLITEFMASNSTSLLDGDGQASDWVEIYNPTSQTVNLAGWHLTDDAGNLDKWTFPALPQSLLEPGEYLVVFASAKETETYIDPAGYLHTDFALSADGEYLALTNPSNLVISAYAPQYPSQVSDISYGLEDNTEPVTLVDSTDTTSAWVPTNGSLDAPSTNVAPAWTLPGFNDAAWPSSGGGVGVGFDSGDDPIPIIPNGTLLPDGLIGHDLTDADDDGTPNGTIFEGGPNNWPGGEEPPRAIDNTITTKWLAFDPVGAAYGFRFAGAQKHAVNAYTITSANDVPERDPYSWTLSGSNDGINYTVIDTRTAQDFVNRFETRLYQFNNNVAYEYFRFNFQTQFGATGQNQPNSIQMAEIELLSKGPVDYDPLIDLDVAADWSTAQTSVYQRVEFDVTGTAGLVAFWLEMQNDDGFVAYLNGKKVATVRAPSLPNYQSHATAERNDSNTLAPELFNLTPFLGDLVAGTNVLSIHALNFSDSSPDLLSRPRLVATRLIDGTLREVFMSEPTPGLPNAKGYAGITSEPVASVERGFFDAPFQLTISNSTPSADVYYTLDGSAPSPENGTLYTGPILVSHTTTLRAQAFADELLESSAITHTYLFLNDILRQNYQATLDAGLPPTWGVTTPDYGMDPDVIGLFDTAGNPLGGDLFSGTYAATIKSDLTALPTMSIVMDVDDMFSTNGIYTNATLGGQAWERATSVELIYPDGSEGFQIDAGIRTHGGAFRSHSLSRKHSLRLLFKGIYDGNTKLDFPLFGSDASTSFDTIVLRMDSNDGYSWSTTGTKAQYARDEFGRRSQAALGQTASHATRVHLYINGVYWGIYNPVERPDASFAASYYGGEKEEWDAINSGSATDGTLDAWNTLASMSQAVSQASTETARTAAYLKILGLNANGTENPGYDTYLDAANYMDFLIVNFYGGNNDWPHRNWYAARRHGPESQGFVFHVWDYEWTLGLQSDINTNRLNVGDGAAAPYNSLKTSQEFRLQFADRVHRALFNDGALTSASAIARYQEIVAELPEAIVAESARWGDMHRSIPYTKAEWQNEINNVVSFLTNRNSVFLQQLRNAGLYPSVVSPTFSQHGGQVPMGFDLGMSAPAGTIWYTLDGSDPRMIGGGISATAIQYTGSSVDIPGARTVRARVLSGGQWSALNEADFATPASDLRITEIHYNPAAYPGVADRQDMEFFELTNTGSQSLSLAGVKISGFATEPYAFTGGELGAGERIIVARTPAVFESVYGAGFNVAPTGYADANLSNGGEAVMLLGPLGDTLQAFSYSDVAPWPSSPDGGGPSIEIIDPLGNANDASNWRASHYVGGSPGASGIAGDFDGDGAVTQIDWQTWKTSFGQSVARGTKGDGNRDGVVDAADYAAWRDNFGVATSGAGAAANVEFTAAPMAAASGAEAHRRAAAAAPRDHVVAAYYLELSTAAGTVGLSSSEIVQVSATSVRAREDALLLVAARSDRIHVAWPLVTNDMGQSTEFPLANVDELFADLGLHGKSRSSLMPAEDFAKPL